MWSRMFLLSSLAIIFLNEGSHAVPYIKLDSMQTCPVTGKMPELDFTFYEIRENDFALTSRLVLDADVTEDYTYHVAFNVWANGAWQKNVHQRDGDLCLDARTFVRKTWDKVAKGSPGVPDDCPIPAGEHNFTDFELNADDMFLPGPMDGRIQLVGEVMDENELSILCVEFEGRIQL